VVVDEEAGGKQDDIHTLGQSLDHRAKKAQSSEP
jgi:hypothetical protein